MKIIFTLIFITLFSLPSFSQIFSDDLNGIDSIRINLGYDASIYDFYNDQDNNLFIMGGISYVNGIPANKVFSWNGDSIKTYSNGNNIKNGPRSILKFNDTIYIGGGFVDIWDHTKDFLTLWNGESWQGLRSGQPNSTVWDMCIFDNKLWICGDFGDIGEVHCDKIASYNGNEWENVGDFGMWARALEVFDGELYAAGYWGIRRYLGGTDWETFPIRPNDYINALKVDTFNTFLYVGGQFTEVDGMESWGCAMWDGFRWNAMNNEYGNTVWNQAMTVYRGDLYTGHCVGRKNGLYSYFISRWDGERWDSLGGDFNSTILALEVFRDELYIGGNFKKYDGQRSKGIRKMSFPDNGCDYIKPRINTFSDTFHLEDGEAEVHFYNNNPYVDSWNWDFGDGNISTEKDPVHIYTAEGEYTVSVTVTHNECIKSWSKTITVDDFTRINQYENLEFEIYPNPSETNFIVKLDLAGYKNAELRINGLNGHLKTIIPVDSNEILINTDYWKPGIYFCTLFIDGKLIRTEKLILN